MSLRFWRAAGLALLVAAGGGLSACGGGDTVTYNHAENAFFPTRANAIATPVSDSWHAPTGSSINPARMDSLRRDDFRVFRARDGAGIVAFTERDHDLYLAYYGPSGAVGQPVPIRGDFTDSVSSGDIVRSMVVVWTPQGDAVIAFIAEQAGYPLQADDVASDRVYFTTFQRSLAGVSHAASGEEYGFDTRPDPVDTNAAGPAGPTNDDDGVRSLFVATDLVDGSTEFAGAQVSRPDRPSGDPGDAVADHGGHFIFLGWVDEDGERAEGGFVNLDRAQTEYLGLGPLQAVSTTPALVFNPSSPTTGDYLTGEVWTSGRDLLFKWRQQNGSGMQDRFSLVRVNAARAGLDAGIDVGRGDATSSTTSSLELRSADCFVGDGYRALNGQTATWLFFTQDDFVDGSSVTNPDKDLVIARVDDAGQVSIAELDHEGATATSTDNHVRFEACLLGRGASRALLLYRQIQDATNGAVAGNESLFARAVYLDGSTTGSSWANAVSDEVRINQTVGVTPTVHDPDVTEVWTPAVAPYCQPQYDNDAFHVAFAQRVEGLFDKSALRYARLVMHVPADVSASKVSLVATESTIEGQLDTGWGATLHNVALAEAGAADGAVVFYSANGNHKADDSPANDFVEHRVYAWAHRLPDTTSTPALSSTEVSSHAAGLPGDWNQVKDWELQVTPLVAASRDFELDTDTAPAEFAHLLLHELDTYDDSPPVLRGRALDLRNGVSIVGAERFFPGPDLDPALVSAGRHTQRNDELWTNRAVLPSGNALVATFPENGEGDHEGIDDTLGQLFVNTFDPAKRSWSDAALLSNESREELYSKSQRQWVALIAGTQNGCADALGAWAFWTKSPGADGDDDESLATYIQGRRFTGVALPPR